MNGGRIIAEVLQRHGVRFLFTLCGGHISPIFVEAKNLGLRVIDTRHEANAVFAADAVGRLTGIPGVAAVTAGPGLTNTITAVKNALLAQSPLVLLGGAAATILKGRGSLQDIDQMSLMKPNVKWSASISSVADIVPTLEKAFQKAQEGVPGPVFVECPIDTLYGEEMVREWYGAKSKEVPPKDIKERLIQWYINRHAAKIFEGKSDIRFNTRPLTFDIPTHKAFQLDAAIRWIKSAKKPLMIIGSGAIMQPAKADALNVAIEHLGIPVYLSGMARGLLGRNHPLQLRHKRKEAIKDADLIILAGVPNDFRLDYGNHIGHRPFISVNRSRDDLFKNKRPTIPIVADPQDFLIALGSKLSIDCPAWLEQLKHRDSDREAAIDQQAAESMTGMNPLELFRKLEPLLGNQAALVADGGDFVATASYTLSPSAPLTWLDPGVFGTLGVGAGFAMGAKLVYPEKDVWIIYGDGSAGYSLVEYDTFVRHKLPIISLIGNDACWAQIARDQVDFLQSDCAVMLEHSDYQDIGKAFGADGQKVADIKTFESAVESAQKASRSGKPYIINAVIGRTSFRKGSISV
jgi:thiamine pyrophosphate-dependent acetolactate synthase large subunit-like protein